MSNDTGLGLSTTECEDLRRIADVMIPPSNDYGVPGAGDRMIFDDMLRSLGRDHDAVRAALAQLATLAGGAFSALDPARQEAVAMAFLDSGTPDVAVLGRVVLQCYYRDDRVLESLGMEARAPFPKGHTVEQGDWSLLDPVRKRPRFWRDAP